MGAGPFALDLGLSRWHDRVPVKTIQCCLLLALFSSLQAAETPPAERWNGRWSFDGDLSDASGNGLDAHATSPVFGAGIDGRALDLKGAAVIIPDAPGLRVARGFRFQCRVRLSALPQGKAWADIFVKGDYSNGEYILRVDPAAEGGRFSFFVNSGGWEPRMRSRKPVKTGVWYEIAGGWDVAGLWLSVDGEMVRVARPGLALSTQAPIRVGPLDGQIDTLMIASPGAERMAAASWRFEGDLRDASGHGRDMTGPGARFVPVGSGRALEAGSASPVVGSTRDLQLAPGFRLDCSVLFNEVPAGFTTIAEKAGEYFLRLDSKVEGNKLAFFVNVDGVEPRVRSDCPILAGTWYRVRASWDGLELALDVNGISSKIPRSGVARTGDGPFKAGRFNGLIDNLRIENPRVPVVRVTGVSVDSTLLRAGRTERLAATVRNLGDAVPGCSVQLEAAEGMVCETPATIDVGALPAGAEKAVEWRVRSESPRTVMAKIRLKVDGAAPSLTQETLAFLPASDPDFSSGAWNPPSKSDIGATTYYIDAAKGDNANPGTTEATAWKDFTPVNDKVLGPGERLLIRRGSVINQELQISAKGAASNWAEIGTYGEGSRPIIRRNWDIGDRCVLVRDPDYLRIRGLTVCHAAKGLVVSYTATGHRGLLIEDCIAHHIEGLYRFNSHGIPEWRDRRGPEGDHLFGSAGIGVGGAAAEDIVIRGCEMFQCSWGFMASGDAVAVDRVFCHDNHAHNTSPHPALVSIRRSYLQRSIFDASGWHAHAGTMGIMLVSQYGLVIRGCHFLNQPDSGSHDEGGIDFEARGMGCLVDGCTFRNNAGAAIEILGLKSPQARNVEIAGSRFIKNNTARKLGPSEIFVWGRTKNPEVCCSTGVVRDNGYVLNPGVAFFTNEAPASTSWTLRNNTEYPSVAELEKAMPLNNPPQVDAGAELWTDRPMAHLAASVTDDGRPSSDGTRTRWEVLEGPAQVRFGDPTKAATDVACPATGDYTLRLVADDGQLWRSDHTVLHVLPPGTSVARSWAFDRPLDKEGWTDWELGTRDMSWSDGHWDSVSKPVKLVAGGYYIVAIEESPSAHLLSPDALGVDLSLNRTVTIRFQNHTPAKRMKLRFTTADAPAWDAGQGRAFDVTPNDNGPRTYELDMKAVPGWSGRLKQLRLDFADGAPLTGTCRIDYIWIGKR